MQQATRVRDPRGTKRAVLRALKKIARERRAEEFDASIATVERYVEKVPMPSKTTIYRAALGLAEEGHIRIEHQGSRRTPFHIVMLSNDVTATEAPASTEPVVASIRERLDRLMAALSTKDEVINQLRAENESLNNEVKVYKECVVEMSNTLEEVAVAV